MREQYEKHETYESFESQLFIEIAVRQMEDECYGNNGRTMRAVTEDAEYHAHTGYPEDCSYSEAPIWDPWLGTYVGALAPKRFREETEESEEARDVRPREEKGKGKGKSGKGIRVSRAGRPCWTCGGPDFQRECPLTSN